MSPRNSDLNFSQRHPFLFGFSLLMAAVVLIFGAMAAFRFWIMDSGPLWGAERIGVVNVEGLIADPMPVTRWMAQLRDDEDVRGVLLRVDSPGGVIGPSQEIYQAVRKLAAIKPVVVSMGAVAASGGYYVSAPATRIVANPGTVTGSIGVKIRLSNMQGLMEKLGIGYEAFTSGKFKDSTSPFNELSDEERQYFKDLVMEMYDQFVRHVAESRGLEVAKVRELADGRAMTGRQALEAGLVDELGNFEDAVAVLKKLCSIEGKVALDEGPKKERSWLLELITGSLGLRPVEQVQGPRWEFLYQ